MWSKSRGCWASSLYSLNWRRVSTISIRQLQYEMAWKNVDSLLYTIIGETPWQKKKRQLAHDETTRSIDLWYRMQSRGRQPRNEPLPPQKRNSTQQKKYHHNMLLVTLFFFFNNNTYTSTKGRKIIWKRNKKKNRPGRTPPGAASQLSLGFLPSQKTVCETNDDGHQLYDRPYNGKKKRS